MHCAPLKTQQLTLNAFYSLTVQAQLLIKFQQICLSSLMT